MAIIKFRTLVTYKGSHGDIQVAELSMEVCDRVGLTQNSYPYRPTHFQQKTNNATSEGTIFYKTLVGGLVGNTYSKFIMHSILKIFRLHSLGYQTLNQKFYTNLCT